MAIDEDYYKSIRTKSAFNSIYIEYEIKGDKRHFFKKDLSIKECINFIRPYLSDINWS